MIRTEILEQPLDAQRALDACGQGANGAIDVFVGQVRNRNDGRDVDAVSYDLHRSLCEQTFKEICVEAAERFGDALDYYLAHRHGRLAIGEASVIAAVGAPHRAEAFEACRFLVERMKHRAPIWKQEHYVDGDSEWLPGHALHEPA
jgi:molybdopterin synthase catalytic subunit